MVGSLSVNTKAILLLTAPLSGGAQRQGFRLVSPGEYLRLAQLLKHSRLEPADLLGPRRTEALSACSEVLSEPTADKLLGRGLQLSQAVERWNERSIWVVSRADAGYPQRLIERYRWRAPAVLYGCGEGSLLDSGGLAVFGPPKVDKDLSEAIREVAALAGMEGKTIVSGGGNGAGIAAMEAALEEGGSAVAVLSGQLERKALDRGWREALMDNRLVLVSPHDPGAKPSEHDVEQANRLIYGLSDAGLVLDASLGKGANWDGAIDQLKKIKTVPVYVRRPAQPAKALDALHQEGALPWPQPCDAESFRRVFASPAGAKSAPAESEPAYRQLKFKLGNDLGDVGEER